MALDVLKERMRCPKCGGRDMRVWFEVPDRRRTAALPAE
jgi:hypothetical protein